MSRYAAISSTHPRVSIALRGVRWAISPDALRMYVPAMLNGHAAQVSEAQLLIGLDGPGPCATLRLRYGANTGAEHALPLPAAASVVITRDDAVGLEHIEVAGVLSMTLRRDHTGSRLIYAHSPLLAAIGLPGGVYDVPELL